MYPKMSRTIPSKSRILGGLDRRADCGMKFGCVVALCATVEDIRRRGNSQWAPVADGDAILEWAFAHRIDQCKWSSNLSGKEGGPAQLSMAPWGD